MSILNIKEQGDKGKIYATSKEYLQLVLNKAENKQFRGPPEMMWGVDLCNNHKYGGEWLILAEDVGFNFAREAPIHPEPTPASKIFIPGLRFKLLI